MKPAPAEIFRLRTVTSKSVGAPSFVWSSVRLYCVLATQIGQLPIAKSLELFCLFLGICCQNNSLAAVDFLYDLVQFVLNGAFQFIGIGKVVWLFDQTQNFFCKFDSAFAAFCPYFGKCYVYAKFFTFCFYKVKLCLCICRECIDSNNTRKLVYILDVAYMFQKVRKYLSPVLPDFHCSGLPSQRRHCISGHVRLLR